MNGNGAHAPMASGARARLEALEIERFQPHRVRCRSLLACGPDLLVGMAEATDAPGAALEVAARAVLAAWAESREPGTGPFELEGVRVTEIAGQKYVTAAVRAYTPRKVQYLAGAAAIGDGAEEAAALAALQATERWQTEKNGRNP